MSDHYTPSASKSDIVHTLDEAAELLQFISTTKRFDENAVQLIVSIRTRLDEILLLLQKQGTITSHLVNTTMHTLQAIRSHLSADHEDEQIENEASIKPSWNQDLKMLTFEGKVVKHFKVPAQNQEIILSVFQEEDWPIRIDDPLPVAKIIKQKQRLHDTINSLNRNRKNDLLTFKGDGTGEGVIWESWQRKKMLLHPPFPIPEVTSGAKPLWESERKQLLYGGRLVKHFRVPSPRQTKILDAFQEENWPVRIDDPLPSHPDIPPERLLHDTIKSLNGHQNPRLLTFRGDGNGKGVLWEPTQKASGNGPIHLENAGERGMHS